MALSINTNLFSLNAQRNLRKTESPLRTAMERLSSGLRINSARDDAAGLAIATRMDTSIRGLSVAMRNANDGLSFAQTAEGAVDEMVNALQRMYELAVQSSSHNTSADRSSLDKEVQDMIAELNRIVDQTRFNGEKFLNRQVSWSFQVGAKVGETITVSTDNLSPTSKGISTTYSNSWDEENVARAAASIFQGRGDLDASMTLNGESLGSAISATDAENNSKVIVDKINTYTADTGITAFSFGNALVATAAVSATSNGSADSGYLTINGVSIGAFQVTSAASTTAVAIASAINAKYADTGVKAYVHSDGRLVLANTTGAGISYSVDTSKFTAAADGTFSSGLKSAGGSVDAGANGAIVLNDDDYGAGSVSFDSSATAAAMGFGLVSMAVSGTFSSEDSLGNTSSGTTTVSLTNTSVNDLSVTTVGNAKLTMLAVEEVLDSVNSFKAELGAKMNRLESTIRNLDNVRENVTAARSRIMDADFAAETAKLTQTMILQQAGISVLAQANTLPQNVLALLQG